MRTVLLLLLFGASAHGAYIRQDLTNTKLDSVISALGTPMQEHTTNGSPISCKLVNVAGAFYDAGGGGASVSVSNFPASQAVTGTFWPVTQPVSGTFWQATQPVSIASMPSTPVTGTFWQGTQPVSGIFWQSTQPVSIASMPSTPVTGAFWQATQPVSLATAPTTPVTGAFWQATQPVSGTFWQATQPVTPPALTKGTQGATGFSSQDLKDAGRNQTTLYMTLPVVTTATDALQSLTGYKAGAAVVATTTPAVVTAAKTYRITNVTITYVAIATAGSVKFTLRANTSGVVAIGSPAVQVWVVGGPAVAAGVSQTANITIPDGMEFAAGTGVGVSMVGLGATQAAAIVGYGQIAIHGFEY